MSDLTLVQISCSFSMSPQEYLDTVQQVAGAIAEQPGLVWKIWPFDEATRQGGGVCLFDSRQDAVGYLEGPIVQEFKVLPGIENVEVAVTGVAADLSAITHAQLSRVPDPVS